MGLGVGCLDFLMKWICRKPAGIKNKFFLWPLGRQIFVFVEKHVPGILNMPKCRKVSKCMTTRPNDATVTTVSLVVAFCFGAVKKRKNMGGLLEVVNEFWL